MDNEINYKLALAIGYLPEHVKEADGGCVVYRPQSKADLKYPSYWGWEDFDYTDWYTIAPIAERFNLFPNRDANGDWFVLLRCGGGWTEYVYGKTPQEAIALAVIERETKHGGLEFVSMYRKQQLIKLLQESQFDLLAED